MRFMLIMILVLSPICSGLRADINHDGIVDFLDFQILSEEWLMSEYGTELVTNGSFTGGLTGWIAGSGWTGADDKAVFSYIAEYGTLSQSISAVTGKSYSVTYTVSDYNLPAEIGTVRVLFGGTSGTNRTADGIYTQTITAISTGSLIFQILNPTIASGLKIDTVSVKEISNVGTLWEQALLQTLYSDAAVSAYLGSSTTGIFNNYVPPTRTEPYVIYEQISGPRDYTFDGPNGLATIAIQLNLFASTYLECRTLADVIRRKLDGFEGTVSLTGGGTVKILETKLRDEGDIPSERPDNTVIYGKRQDYEMVIDERP